MHQHLAWSSHVRHAEREEVVDDPRLIAATAPRQLASRAARPVQVMAQENDDGFTHQSLMLSKYIWRPRYSNDSLW
jgi:hypothetical protein